VRIVPALLLAVCLIGCNRASQDKDAVRQGIMDYLKARAMNLPQMDVNMTSVQFNGKTADASVSFVPKSNNGGPGMSFVYQLEQQGTKWVVVGRKEAGGAPHGGMPAGGAMPGTESQPGPAAAPAVSNPHGGAQMPAPESLPPAGTKK
jgi:hypothetical protein